MSYQGYKLRALHQHLLTVMPPSCHALLDSWMERGTLRLTPANMGPTGRNVATVAYLAVFVIESVPFRVIDPAVVLASLAAWLQDHDSDRERDELPDPEFVVTADDEHTADLEIQVHFVEPLALTPDAKGPVVYDDQRWQVVPYDIWTAEAIELHVGDTRHLAGGDR